MATSALVADISPLLNSLQRFTPQGREDRALELAGLQQRDDIRSAQLQQVQATNKRNQILDLANENRVELIGDKNDLAFALKDGPQGLRNNLAQLASQKGQDSQDMAELVQFANMAINDPEGAFDQLTSNQEGINLQLKTVDEILGRVGQDPTALQQAQTAKTLAETERIESQVSGGGALPAETVAFNELIKNFSTEEQKVARRVKVGLKGRAVSNAVLSAIESGDVKNLADAKSEIRQAEKFAELTGSSRAKAIDKGFDSIVKIDRGIVNIDNAISAIEGGAGVGAVQKLWPSIRAASVELDNIRGRMALDVVGATTFGALSKGELDLAKNVALPTGLDTEELKGFLARKKAAQQKLRAYYNEQIQFLDQGGTVAGFLREKERGQSAVPGGAAPTQQAAQPVPQGLVDNGDGTFTLPDGRIVRRTGG